MGWTITFGTDKVVDLDDFAPATFDLLAEQDADDNATWWAIYAFPAASNGRLYRVICAAAEVAQVDPPDAPATMRDAKRLLDMLDRTEDIADLPMIDGFPQMPDEPENGSSSGPSGDSDGLPTSAEPNEPATS